MQINTVQLYRSLAYDLKNRMMNFSSSNVNLSNEKHLQENVNTFEYFYKFNRLYRDLKSKKLA